MTLFTLRHRKGNHAVILALIQIKEPTGDPVKDMLIAEAIGQAYCNAQINAKYIKVEPAILADESVIDSDVLDKILNPPARPKREDPKGPERVPLEDAPNATARGDNNLDDLGDDDEDDEEEDKEPVPAPASKTKGKAKTAAKTGK